MVAPDLITVLAGFHKVRIAMPERDGLKEGRDLVVSLQMACGFPLVYVQRLGCDPIVLVWRMRDDAMEGYRVERYQA